MVIGGWPADGIADAGGIQEWPSIGMVMPGIGSASMCPAWGVLGASGAFGAWTGAGFFFFAGPFFPGTGFDGIVIPGMCMDCARRGAAVHPMTEVQSRSETGRRMSSPDSARFRVRTLDRSAKSATPKWA
jgi:hypothetical protein